VLGVGRVQRDRALVLLPRCGTDVDVGIDGHDARERAAFQQLQGQGWPGRTRSGPRTQRRGKGKGGKSHDKLLSRGEGISYWPAAAAAGRAGGEAVSPWSSCTARAKNCSTCCSCRGAASVGVVAAADGGVKSCPGGTRAAAT